MAVNPSAPTSSSLEEGSISTRKPVTPNHTDNKTTTFNNIILPIIVELVNN
jgi:hypothetical protein